MSLHTATAPKRGVKKYLATGLVGAGFIGLAIAGTGAISGANFTASGEGSVSGSTATVALDLSDASNSGTFKLGFDKLVPGVPQTDTFTVKSNADIVTDGKLSANPTGATFVVGPDLTASDYADLTVAIPGVLDTPTAIDALPAVLDLGEFQPGETKTFNVTLSLREKGVPQNEWQSAKFGAGLTVTIEQQN